MAANFYRKRAFGLNIAQFIHGQHGENAADLVPIAVTDETDIPTVDDAKRLDKTKAKAPRQARQGLVPLDVDQRLEQRRDLPVDEMLQPALHLLGDIGAGLVIDKGLHPRLQRIVARDQLVVTAGRHGATRRLTDTPEQERSVSFHPKGRGLLYASERGGSWNLYRTDLTDDDGPYIELMAGVYTDNQPDFSWLRPYETKTFSQFWPRMVKSDGSMKSSSAKSPWLHSSRALSQF